MIDARRAPGRTAKYPPDASFLKKKKQKTIAPFGARWLTTARLTKQKVFLLLFLQKKKILPTRSKGIQSVVRFLASGDPTNLWFRTLALCFAEQVYAPADRIWAHHALNIVGRYRWWRNRELMTAIHPV